MKDTVKIRVDKKLQIVEFSCNIEKHAIPIELKWNQDIYICCSLYYKDDSVQILAAWLDFLTYFRYRFLEIEVVYQSFLSIHLSFFSISLRSENLPSISWMLISFHYFPLSLLNLVKIYGIYWFSEAIIFLADSGT